MKLGIGAGLLAIAVAAATASYALSSASGQPGTSGAQQSETASSPAPDACARLADLKLPNTEITLAGSQPEGARLPPAGLTSMYGKTTVVATGLPAFCRVAGHIHPEPGSDIGFEIWLPSRGWDGRLHGIGIGGFAGGIDYFSLGVALKAGQAGVASDTGHSGTMQESSWAKGHPARVHDYGWRGIHLATVTAKKLVAAFYGHGPDKSYFVGCSGGGRQGLMEAARYPEDYDGIVAGAPAANFTDLVIAMTNAAQAQRAPGAAIRWDQTHLLQDEVIRQCDGKDGQVDGLVDDPRICRFDAAKLACGTSTSPQCFSTPQIAALQRIHLGARDSHGRKLSGGYLPSGSEAGNPSPVLGWEGYLLPAKGQPSGGDSLASGILTDLIQKPFTTTADFNFDRDPARLKAALSNDLDPSADLHRYFARGGKLIIWHGWADAAIPPEATLRYHDALLRQSGAKAGGSVRLFMVPDVQHCSGGVGPDVFGQGGTPKPGTSPDRDMVAALQTWVEGHRPAPETLIGRRGHSDFTGKPEQVSERQRLLCAWPKKARLRSAGDDPDKAASYACA